MKLGSAQIIQGNALNLPLPDASVDLICTSPPYFGLRSYQDAGEHYAGQIGSEATIDEWLQAMLAATREMMRVLKSTGSAWVNLGDKYSPTKSLLGLPWRYAIACIDQLGLILRAEIIWAKPNGLPESVTDRVRRSHEQWFHLTKSPRYFAAVDEIREPQKEMRTGKHSPGHYTVKDYETDGMTNRWNPKEYNFDPRGKLPGSVWTVPTQPLQVPPELGVDHFAAYPMEWPRRIIQGWTPNGICTACDQPRVPIVNIHSEKLTGSHGTARGFIDGHEPQGNKRGINADNAPRLRQSATIAGYRCCGEWPSGSVQPSTTPAIVLDPFGGTGTTALVAKALGRTGITVDLSSDYCRLAQWRCNDPRELAAALQIEKPEPVHPDQLELFT